MTNPLMWSESACSSTALPAGAPGTSPEALGAGGAAKRTWKSFIDKGAQRHEVTWQPSLERLVPRHQENPREQPQGVIPEPISAAAS